MSRTYEMSVEVTGFNLDKAQVIWDALQDEWEFEDEYGEDIEEILSHSDQNGKPSPITASGISQLCGGETEEEFAARITHAVWKANGAYCEVDVTSTCLENLPYETHNLDEAEYQKWAEKP